MFSSLRSKLALSHITVILIGALVLGGLAFTLIIDLHKKESFELLDRSVTNSTLQIKQYFAAKNFLLQTIIDSSDVAAFAKKYQHSLLFSYFKKFQTEFKTINYIMPNGTVELRVEDGKVVDEVKNFSTNRLFIKASQNPREVVFDLNHTEKNAMTLDFAIALKNYFGDELLCVIFASIPFSDLEQHLLNFTSEMNDQLIILDADNTIILHPNRNLIGIHTAPFEASGFSEIKVHGIKGLYTSRHLEIPDLTIVKVMPHEVYISTYKQLLTLLSVALFIVTLIGLIASIFISSRITAPVKRLTEAISQVASGKHFDEVEKYSIKELDSMVDSFNFMSQELADTTISQEYLDNILNSLQEGLFVVNLDGTIESANQRLLEMLETSEDDLLGEPINRILQDEEILSFIGKEGKTNFSGIETHFITHNKQTVPIQFFLSELLDDDGDKIGYVCLALDISHKKQIEKETEQLRYQLHQSQRLESVGTLASGIAHDFNNILTVVIGFSQLLKDKVKEDPIGENAIKQILTASYRARDLVKQLLAFSRQEEHRKIAISPIPIIKETLKMLRSSIPAYVSIEQNIPTETYSIFADPSQIQQVLMNLCTNAAQAIKKSGTISVSLGNIELDHTKKTAPYNEIPDGDFVEIVVSDTGHGIKSHDLENIFDPFFTTKEVDEGTGLGLSVVHGIVENLKGHILVQSQENIGTTFRILIPKTDKDTKAPLFSAETSSSLVNGHGEHILFVDDERSLVELLENNLTLRGYEVTATTCPEKAYELFKANPDSFDIVITDFAMPKFKGDELVHKIHELNPDIPVILCTGYHAKLLGMHDMKGISRVIKKPYTANELVYNIVHILKKP